MDNVAPYIQSRRRLIILKFNYRNISSHSQKRSNNFNVIKANAYYAINTQYLANAPQSHRANIETLHLQHAVPTIDVALEKMVAIQKRLAQMLHLHIFF